MKILYFWDAYCGWCYGFDKIFTKFYENHTDVEIEIISGGLFIGDNSKRIKEYGYFQEGNKKISEMYNVEFGEKYNEVLEEGEMVLNSVHPAIAMDVIKELIPTDFIRTLNLGIESYPTAVMEKDGEYYDLRGYATVPEDIETHYNLIAKRF